MRIKSLDSLRGVAAVIVVIYHTVIASPINIWDTIQNSYILRPIVAGKEVVLLFFALSGFVLYVSIEGVIEKFNIKKYSEYLIKRIFRIYPAHIIVIICSIAIIFFIKPKNIPFMPEAFSKWWSFIPTLNVVIGHFLILYGEKYINLNNVIWSLFHEVRISILFPVIAFFVKKHKFKVLVISFITSVIAQFFYKEFGDYTEYGFFSIFKYVFLFSGGAVLASCRESIKHFFERKKIKRLVPIFLIISISLITIKVDRMLAVPTSVGVFLILTICFANKNVDNFLSKGFFTWLGRISYGLYLVHYPILLTIIHTLIGKLPIELLLAMVLPVSMIVAELIYRYVESPGIKLGRNIINYTISRYDTLISEKNKVG